MELLVELLMGRLKELLTVLLEEKPCAAVSASANAFLNPVPSAVI